MNGPGPLFPERDLSRRLWGDPLLADLLGVDRPAAGDPFGESWQAWGGSRIRGGPLAGQTLQQAADTFGAELLGSGSTARYGTSFPLLVKLIAAAQDLSVQVHPDDAYARQHHSGSGQTGKAEAWLILAARPGAAVYRGFRRDVSGEEVRTAIADGTLPELLNRIPVREGDVIFNPPGTVHAIGAGILLFEVQQPSDLTYRLYDYGRRGADGQPRELHVEHALAVADLRVGGTAPVQSAGPVRGQPARLLETPYFTVTRHQAAAGGSLSTGRESLAVLTALNGPVSLSDGAELLELGAWESLVLPARERDFRLGGAGQLIDCRLPAQVPAG